MDRRFYFDFLYPFQDEVLRLLRPLDTKLYLTGGTAASRGYLHHRFSDDLDFFANDAPEFGLWAARAIDALASSHQWRVDVLLPIFFIGFTLLRLFSPLLVSCVEASSAV